MIPTTQVSSERNTIHLCLAELAMVLVTGFMSYPALVRLLSTLSSPELRRPDAVSLPVWIKVRNATASTRLIVVTRERKKRTLMDWYAIWKDLDKGNATKRLIDIPAWCIRGTLVTLS